MKISTLDLNVGKNIYEVAIQDVCDSTQGYYDNKEEAIRMARVEYNLIEGSHPVHVLELVWSEEDTEYIYANERDYDADITVEIIEEV